MKILAISGSLRAASTNSQLLHAIARLAPPDMEFEFYEGNADLPHFSPDLDTDDGLPSVRALRDALASVDGVVVSTPEYAHGMPGSLKNLLDWLVSSGEFDAKPTAVISASPLERGGDRAHAALAQTLIVLGAQIPDGASVIIPFVRTKLGADATVTDSETAAALRAALDAIRQAVDQSGSVS